MPDSTIYISRSSKPLIAVSRPVIIACISTAVLGSTAALLLMPEGTIISQLQFWLDAWQDPARNRISAVSPFDEESRMDCIMLLVGAMLYAMLLSLPFIPGFELGLLLMLTMGDTGIVVVYLASVVGLNLSFAMGRWMPRDWTDALLGSARAKAQTNPVCRHLNHLLEKAGRRTSSCSVMPAIGHRHRYLLLAILFNLPGNTLLGGGGGIALMSGMNRGLSWIGFLLTVAVATAPIPLLALLGTLSIESLLNC